MARQASFRRLVVQLIGDRTETIPVRARYELPNLGDVFVTIEAADKSTVIFRTEHIISMHLKAPDPK